MPDDSNARKMEAALNESDEPEIVDGKTRAERLVIEEEAIAEEEFVADQEDTVNPLIYDQKESKSDASGGLEGAFGSEGLADEVPVKPINNEEELRKESVNEDNLDPTLKSDGFGTDSNPDLAVDELSGLETELSSDNEVAMSAEAGNATPDATANAVATDAPMTGAIMSGAAGASNMPSGDVAAPTTEVTPATDAMNTTSTESATSAAVSENVAPAAPTVETTTPVATPEMTAATGAVMDAAPTTPVVASAEPMQAAVATTPQPIPAGMPTSSAPATTVAPTMGAQPKKKKTGLIITLIVLFVLLIGGTIFGVIWYNQHEAPERQVSDAINNLLTAPILGTTSSETTAADNGNLPMLGLSIQSNKMTPDLKGETIKGSFAIKDAQSFYVRLNGITPVISESAVDEDVTEEEKKLAEDLMNKFKEILEDRWISIKLESNESEGYECLTEASDKLSSEAFRNKLSELYHANEFVSLKEGSTIESRDGINYYEVEIDETKSDAFGEALEETDEVKELSTCVSDVMKSILLGGSSSSSSSNSSTSSAYKSSEDLDDDDDTVEKILLGIAPWTHELKAIEVQATDADDGESYVKFAINFDSVNSDDLGSASDIKDVYESLMSAYKEATKEYTRINIREYCEEYDEEDYLSLLGYDSVDECVDDFMEDYEDSSDSSSASGLSALGMSYDLSDTETIDNFDLLNL